MSRSVVEAVINEELIAVLMVRNKWTVKYFHEELTEKYGLHIGYKMFVKLMKNKYTWKLTYALALCDFLDMDVRELFTLEKRENVEFEK